MKQETLRLRQWAQKFGFTYKGAYNAFCRGDIEGAYQLETGTILIPITEDKSTKPEYTAIYTRVSSHKQKPDLKSQTERVSQFCTAKGWQINEIQSEVASGLNDDRPKLNKLLSNQDITRIVVEHKDRLTRFGFNYIINYCGKEIVVINEVVDDEEDLMQDFVSIITSMTARLYGKRRSKRKTETIIKELAEK